MYVSLKDVAARAGVSFQTASKALRGQSGVVSLATRERIEEAARDLGYVPNALARGLVNQSSVTIGILIDDVADLALSQFLVAAQRETEAQGHTTLVANTRGAEDPALAVRQLREHRVAGVLVITPSLEDDPRLGDALRGSLPAVSLTHVHGGEVPLVGSDHRVSGALAAEHLLALGHEKIGTVTGPRSRRVVAARLQGFRAALKQAGHPLPARCVEESEWTPAGGHAAAHRLLDAVPDLTAVFVQNDIMAVGVIRALWERDLDVPAGCSVVSCDDMDLVAYLTPPLTSVHIPFAETGKLAATRLVEHVRGETVPPPRELLPVHLVVRASAGPPRPSPNGAVRSTTRARAGPTRPARAASSRPAPRQGPNTPSLHQEKVTP